MTEHATTKLRNVVIKYGGSARSETPQNAERAFAQDIAQAVQAGISCTVVHGGGKDLSAWMSRLGLTPRFVEGQRYTDDATLEIAEMVLSAKMNKSLAALITEAGVTALGLSGRDGKLLVAAQITSSGGAGLGRVGEVHSVNGSLLATLLASGIVPVLSPIASDGREGALNCNADHIAAVVAERLSADLLILLTDVDAITLDGAPLAHLSLAEGRALLNSPEIRGGMLPKLDYGLRAIGGGVKKVVICNAHCPRIVARCISGEQLGTWLVP